MIDLNPARLHHSIQGRAVGDLSHTFSSHLAMAEIDLTMNKELLSHEALAMTILYTHLAPSHNFALCNIRSASHTQAIALCGVRS
jgi:site-specific recombinase XerC